MKTIQLFISIATNDTDKQNNIDSSNNSTSPTLYIQKLYLP